MKKTIKFRFAGIGIVIVMLAVFGAVVMLLWNALMPRICSWKKKKILSNLTDAFRTWLISWTIMK